MSSGTFSYLLEILSLGACIELELALNIRSVLKLEGEHETNSQSVKKKKFVLAKVPGRRQS